MECAQAATYIECYADGELDPVASARVEEHLRGCAACQHELEQLTSLRSAIRQAAPYHKAPEGLANRVRAKAGVATHRAAPRLQFRLWQWLRPTALVAVTAAVTWIVASQVDHPSPRELIAEEVISSHARSALTGHLTNVASSERHTVKPWLSSKLDFSPPVVDLGTAGFPLIGGRVDYVDQRPVAVLVYGRRKHIIDVFVWPNSTAGPAAPAPTLSKQGFQVLHWARGGMTFWAVSDLNAPEMKSFAEAFAASM